MWKKRFSRLMHEEAAALAWPLKNALSPVFIKPSGRLRDIQLPLCADIDVPPLFDMCCSLFFQEKIGIILITFLQFCSLFLHIRKENTFLKPVVSAMSYTDAMISDTAYAETSYSRLS